ncbi:MAG: hypothetical protein CMI26_12610, partial [Opitutae bacterium]|nr:hypothetical protein [Opitutae bacterium]
MKNLFLCLLSLFPALNLVKAEDIPPIPRRIPPQGIEIPDEDRNRIQSRLSEATESAERIRNHPDVAVFRKAVRFALLNGEFYDKKHFALADKLLDEADRRTAFLTEGETPWTSAKQLVVRGFRSKIDDSVQPYGLEVPEKLQLNRPVPLYVWLHGRGDKNTDLHFIGQRMSRSGKFVIEDGIVLHPFGRQCMGYKSAGETDVMEAIEAVQKEYRIDKQRIALMGFSMGGAGAWHLGARYADKWAVVHAGAGFAETARYNRLAKENYPPWYEQRLWNLYDVPGYARNLFNFPVIAYSGEIDKQKQAADVMTEAFADHDRELNHVIGPKMGHKYDENSKKKVLAFIRKAFEYGRETNPQEVHLQTQTLRHNRIRWIYATGLIEHWKDSRVDAAYESEAGAIEATTKNISSLLLMHPDPSCCGARGGFFLEIDGTSIQVPPNLFSVPLLRKPDGTW